MHKNHRIERRRIAVLVLTLTHIISYQISLIECLTVGGDYENGKLSQCVIIYFFLHKTNNHYIITHHIIWLDMG